MSTLSHPAISSNTTATGYNSVWASLYDADMQVPQIWNEIINYYGPGVGLLEWQYAAGNIVPIAGPSKTLFEQGSLVKLVTIQGDIAVTLEGADGHLHLAATEFDANGNCYLKVNDIVVIPAKYLEISGVDSTKPELYQVTADNGLVGILREFTIHPLNAHSEIENVVPSGTALMVTGGNYANGVASGSAKSAGWYHRHFTTSTKKADWSMTGSVQSNERYYEKLRGGGNGIFSKASIEADFLLSKYINDEIFLGGGISSTTTQHDRDLNDIQATGTVGILQHLVDGAMKQYYTLAYGYTDFDDIKDLLNSQGVANRDVTFFVGSLLNKQLENAGLDFLKEFSGGTDLMRNLNTIGVGFSAVKKNGINFVIKEIPSFSDPTAYGADAFEDYFTGLGFIVPDVDVTVRGSMESPESFKLKNFSLGFKSYNNENRTRINKVIPGVAEVGAGGGNIAVDTFDDVRGTLLSEFAVIFTGRNQCILVQNDLVI